MNLMHSYGAGKYNEEIIRAYCLKEIPVAQESKMTAVEIEVMVEKFITHCRLNHLLPKDEQE